MARPGKSMSTRPRSPSTRITIQPTSTIGAEESAGSRSGGSGIRRDHNQGRRTAAMIDPQEMCISLANNILQLILMPTEACNFRCTYCYEDFRYQSMHPDVVLGVK